MADDLKRITPAAVGVTQGEACASVVSPVFLDLPVPPSVNQAFKNIRNNRRALSEAGRDWKMHAGHVLARQHPGMVAGPVMIIVNIDRGSMSSDIDNRIKLLFDLLVTEKVIEDDSRITGFAAAWLPPHSRTARLAILPARAFALEFHLSDKTGAHGGWIIPAPETEEDYAHGV